MVTKAAVGPAPLWICFVPQLVSVIGDAFGQRVCRVYHPNSLRHFVLSMCGVASLVTVIGIGFMQVAFPKVTTPIYEQRNKTFYDYCDTKEGRESDHCYAQGPWTIYYMVEKCPFMMFDGAVNIFYFIGEAVLYAHPLGLLLLVLAALASAFIVNPLQVLFQLPNATPAPPVPVIIGIIGAIISLIERQTPANIVVSECEQAGSPYADKSKVGLVQEGLNEKTPLLKERVNSGSASPSQVSMVEHRSDINQDPLRDQKTTNPDSPTSCIGKMLLALKLVKTFIPLLIPFMMLSIAYAFWFVIMDYYNDKCKINLWGYSSFDSGTVPVFIYSTLLIVDYIKPMQKYFTPPDQIQESFWSACRGTLHELMKDKGEGLWNCIIYRVCINGRAMAYMYIVTRYDLAISYLQLTLIRVGLSWICSLLLVLVTPRFIRAEIKEQNQLKDPVNLTLKIVGTIGVVASLVIINNNG